MIEPIAFDTETALIADGLQAPPLVCMSIAHEDGTELVHHTEARSWILALLVSDRVLVGHNVAFDFGVVASKFPDLMPAIFAKYERGEVTDTLLRQKLIDIASSSRGFKSYSLEELARRWLRRPLDKDTWRKRYGELYDVPLSFWPKGAKAYALEDARTTLDLWSEQERAQDMHLADQYRQARAAWWIHLMRSWGLRTDPVPVEALAERLQTKHDEIKAKLVEAGLVRANGSRDVKAASAHMVRVCAAKGVSIKITAKDRVKLDKDTCELTGDATLELYGEYSGLKTRIGNFVKLLRSGTTTPIQAYFDSLKETGRTSSSPNVQNLPRSGGVRECFVPREGKVYAGADYSTFELRTVSQVILLVLGIRSKLAEALNAGFDPHLEIARRIVGCSYTEAVARLAAGDETINDARQVGKVANFGFPGGLGITRFVHFARTNYSVTITEDEARALKTYWIEAWPEFVPYFKWIGDQCEGRPGKIKQVFVERYRGGCSFTEACNTLFQGLAADAAKAAGFLIAKVCYVDTDSPLFGGRIVNFVHDEFIVEVDDDDRAADAAEELARLMVVGASRFLPDVPPLAEPYLARRWSKKAKPVRDEAGRLVPWELST
jgi:DNA polymerase-1